MVVIMPWWFSWARERISRLSPIDTHRRSLLRSLDCVSLRFFRLCEPGFSFGESTLISSVFPIRGRWSLRAISSDDPLKPLLVLLVSDLPSVGSFWFCSRVALEAALDEVGSVLDTRVRLRSWYGIAGRFEWVELELNGWQGDGRGGWQYLGGGLIFIIVGKAQLATPL